MNVLHKRKCANKACRAKFETRLPAKKVCSDDCAVAYVGQVKALELAAKQKAERIEDRKKLFDMKTIPQLKAWAQEHCNRFIRTRDAGKDCISCGRPLSRNRWVGGLFDAGHYRSVGSADHLRYHELNIHGQCKQCNDRKNGCHVDYRIRLLDRIGVDAVLALEHDNTTVKWTREMLIAIGEGYMQRTAALKKERKLAQLHGRAVATTSTHLAVITENDDVF